MRHRAPPAPGRGADRDRGRQACPHRSRRRHGMERAAALHHADGRMPHNRTVFEQACVHLGELRARRPRPLSLDHQGPIPSARSRCRASRRYPSTPRPPPPAARPWSATASAMSRSGRRSARARSVQPAVGRATSCTWCTATACSLLITGASACSTVLPDGRDRAPRNDVPVGRSRLVAARIPDTFVLLIRDRIGPPSFPQRAA